MSSGNSGTNSDKRPAAALSQRAANRFSVSSAAFKATWLANGEVLNADGDLDNISTGGFSVKMSNAPPRGRILHARLNLETVKGGLPKAIEADARVCGRTRFSDDSQGRTGWRVNFAIESMHPADEKLVAQAIAILKARTH